VDSTLLAAVAVAMLAPLTVFALVLGSCPQGGVPAPAEILGRTLGVSPETSPANPTGSWGGWPPPWPRPSCPSAARSNPQGRGHLQTRAKLMHGADSAAKTPWRSSGA
jgi:hypothetical protein